VLPRLRQGGEVTRGWSGVRLGEDEQGVKVEEVFPDSPGAASGLQAGDRIFTVDGRPIRDRRGWTRALGDRFPGDAAVVEIDRGQRRLSYTLELMDHETWSAAMTGPPLEIPSLGIWVRPPAPDRTTGLDPGVGLEVVEVDSSGQHSLFQPGDIIIQLAGQPLRDPMDLPAIADEVARKRRFTAIVMRGGQMSRLFCRW